LQIVVFRLPQYIFLPILARISAPEADYLIIEGNKKQVILQTEKAGS